jgi:hypothetical protein
VDIETIIQDVVRRALRDHGLRLPLSVAAVAADGSVLFTRFSPPPIASPRGSSSQEHVTGHFEADGFPAPIHLMLTDARGQVRVAVVRGSGEPSILSLADPNAEASSEPS